MHFFCIQMPQMPPGPNPDTGVCMNPQTMDPVTPPPANPTVFDGPCPIIENTGQSTRGMSEIEREKKIIPIS